MEGDGVTRPVQPVFGRRSKQILSKGPATMSEIPDTLPDDVEVYGRSPEFTSDNLPAKLQSAHSTKAGTWGLLHVLEGEILYVVEPPRQGERRAAAGETIVIEPETPHHVAFTAPGRMFVEFYRKTAQPA